MALPLRNQWALFSCTTFAIMKTYVVNLLDHWFFVHVSIFTCCGQGIRTCLLSPTALSCGLSLDPKGLSNCYRHRNTQARTPKTCIHIHTHTSGKRIKNTKWKQRDGKHEAFHSKLVRWNHRYVQLVTQWHEGRKKLHLQFPSKRPTRWQMTARQIQIRP